MIAARTQADVIDAVCDVRERHRTLEIVGASTKRAFGRETQCDDVLDVSGISGIVSYEPEELILTVKAGTPVAEITALLDSRNQRLGFEPADWGPLLGAPSGKATIGGVLSADVCGSAAVRYGRARDSLLGYRAVNGLGEAYKAGGKVVKNVTGFDVPKLMCGAMGTLGVLTEVTLRVFPKSSHTATLMVRDVAPEQGLAVLRTIWSSPLEATGLSYLPSRIVPAGFGDVGKGAALIRLEGASEPLREKMEGATALLGGKAESIARTDVFDGIAGAALFVGENLDLWRVCVPPANAAAIIGKIQPPSWFADWAGGLLWVGVLPGNDGVRLRELIAPFGGHATLVKANETTRRRVDLFQPEPPARAALTKAVKAAFDPLGIFNPGRMWDSI